MIQEKIQEGVVIDFIIENDVLKFGHRLCVPQVAELKDEIVREAHNTPYTMYLGSTKIY